MNPWRQIQRTNFISWEPLAEFLELTQDQRNRILKKPHFPLNLPLRLAKKIEKRTLEDPILKQFLPLMEEEVITPHFQLDPVEDASFRLSSKLLQKYQGRALLLCTSACAMNCRFCFRQNYDYDPQAHFREELQIIASDPTLYEVILSGGDPLSLSNEVLGKLVDGISQIPHVKRIRFHTRFPVGIPERIDDDFVNILSRLPQQIWFITHVNHPRELDDEIFNALKRLQKCGIGLLTHSVLLKGINDDLETLYQLCLQLCDRGILPYYLSQLDRVQGASHFEVGIEKGRELIAKLAEILPGYAVPRYMQEIPGRLSKTLLC